MGILKYNQLLFKYGVSDLVTNAFLFLTSRNSYFYVYQKICPNWSFDAIK